MAKTPRQGTSFASAQALGMDLASIATASICSACKNTENNHAYKHRDSLCQIETYTEEIALGVS
jgi:hypothetical protein